VVVTDVRRHASPRSYGYAPGEGGREGGKGGREGVSLNRGTKGRACRRSRHAHAPGHKAEAAKRVAQ